MTSPVLMAAAASVSGAGDMRYTAEDWQAQLEEVLALQSIFADNFRVTHIPGQKLTASPSSDTTTSTATSSNSSTASNRSSTDPSSNQDVEQLIESLIGSEPPRGLDPEQHELLDDLLTFEAIVELEVPAGQLQIILDMHERPLPQQHSCCCNGDVQQSSSCSCTLQKSHSSSNNKVPFGPPIQYLPPFRVQVKYPSSYPSSGSTPPLVTLTACWLSQRHEQQLQEQLQNLWEQQGPGPICFTWLEYLKSDSLTDLEIVKELIMQPQLQPVPQEAHTQCSIACGTVPTVDLAVHSSREAGGAAGVQQQQQEEEEKEQYPVMQKHLQEGELPQQQPVMQGNQQQQELAHHENSPDMATHNHNIARDTKPEISSVPSSHSSKSSNSNQAITEQQTAGQPQQPVLTPRSSLRAAAAPFSPGQTVAPVVLQQRQQTRQQQQQQQQQERFVQQRQRRSKGHPSRQQGTANSIRHQAGRQQLHVQQSNTTVWREVPQQQQDLRRGHHHHHRGRSSRGSVGSHQIVRHQRPVVQHTAQQLHREHPQQHQQQLKQQQPQQQQEQQQEPQQQQEQQQEQLQQQQQQQEQPQQQQQQQKKKDERQEHEHAGGSAHSMWVNDQLSKAPAEEEQQQQQLQQVNAVEQLAVQLLRYSAAREAEAFTESMHTCSICFEQVSGSDCLQLPECRHFYCISCMKHHAAAQLEQGAVENMRCPEPSCRRPFQPYVIKEMLGEAGYGRWEELLLQRTLDKMEDVVYCPRCDTVCIEDPDHCAQCSKCLYVFCSFCSDSWHPGTECLDPHERLRILERRKKATGAGDKHHEMDLVNQLMSLKYLTDVSRKCPSCGMATIKSEGCNKMTCIYCSSHWCWKCRQVIQGYDHFRESHCTMFDKEEVERWNAMMWANERAREVEMGQFHLQVRMQHNPAAFQVCRCPVCGQENLREGRNNLLRCWACNCHFCHSCRSWLRGKVGQHFVGPKACKQHGD